MGTKQKTSRSFISWKLKVVATSWGDWHTGQKKKEKEEDWALEHIIIKLDLIFNRKWSSTSGGVHHETYTSSKIEHK